MKIIEKEEKFVRFFGDNDLLNIMYSEINNSIHEIDSCKDIYSLFCFWISFLEKRLKLVFDLNIKETEYVLVKDTVLIVVLRILKKIKKNNLFFVNKDLEEAKNIFDSMEFIGEKILKYNENRKNRTEKEFKKILKDIKDIKKKIKEKSNCSIKKINNVKLKISRGVSFVEVDNSFKKILIDLNKKGLEIKKEIDLIYILKEYMKISKGRLKKIIKVSKKNKNSFIEILDTFSNGIYYSTQMTSSNGYYYMRNRMIENNFSEDNIKLFVDIIKNISNYSFDISVFGEFQHNKDGVKDIVDRIRLDEKKIIEIENNLKK